MIIRPPRAMTFILLALLAILSIPFAALRAQLAAQGGPCPGIASRAMLGGVQIGQFGGAINKVVAREGLAFIAQGPRLVIADMSDPSQPRLLGQSDPLPGLVSAVALHGARIRRRGV